MHAPGVSVRATGRRRPTARGEQGACRAALGGRSRSRARAVPSARSRSLVRWLGDEHQARRRSRSEPQARRATLQLGPALAGRSELLEEVLDQVLLGEPGDQLHLLDADSRLIGEAARARSTSGRCPPRRASPSSSSPATSGTEIRAPRLRQAHLATELLRARCGVACEPGPRGIRGGAVAAPRSQRPGGTRARKPLRAATATRGRQQGAAPRSCPPRQRLGEPGEPFELALRAAVSPRRGGRSRSLLRRATRAGDEELDLFPM